MSNATGTPDIEALANSLDERARRQSHKANCEAYRVAAAALRQQQERMSDLQADYSALAREREILQAALRQQQERIDELEGQVTSLKNQWNRAFRGSSGYRQG